MGAVLTVLPQDSDDDDDDDVCVCAVFTVLPLYSHYVWCCVYNVATPVMICVCCVYSAAIVQ